MKVSSKALMLSAAVSGLILGSAPVMNASPLHSGNSVSASMLGHMAGDPGTKDKHACKGQNSCKGKGGCKTGDNGCKGKNSCKGKGGCATDGSKPPTEQ